MPSNERRLSSWVAPHRHAQHNSTFTQRSFMQKEAIHKAAATALAVNENVSLEEQIAQRAHELWQQRGHEHGSDLSDWLRAEREVNEWHQQRLRTQPAHQ